MKNNRELRYIGEDLFLEIIRSKENVVINILDNGERIPLENSKINEFIKLNAVNNKDYVIVYTMGYSRNVIPYNIEKIYDINEREIVDIPNDEILDIIENMFISQKIVDAKTAILLINGIIDNPEVDKLYKYLTANNSNITIDMVAKYILEKYPELKRYVGIGKEPITMEYLIETNNFEDKILYLNVMPQKVDEIIENNGGYVKKINY